MNKKKTLGVIGAGHLGLQIAHHALHDNHFDEVIFFDDYITSDSVSGYKVLGNSDDIISSYNKGLFSKLLIGVGYKNMIKRDALFCRFKDDIPFATLVHSTCFIDHTSNIDSGTIIYPGSTIDANVKIGNNVLINIDCTISHDSVIDSHSFLSPKVAVAGFVNIGKSNVIGINSTIIDNLSIANNTKIGAGTVVIETIEKSGLYIGNPHRLVR